VILGRIVALYDRLLAEKGLSGVGKGDVGVGGGSGAGG
jgi:hypothetical protein